MQTPASGEPVGRVGEQLDEVEAALGGGMDHGTPGWNGVPLLAARGPPRQSAVQQPDTLVTRRGITDLAVAVYVPLVALLVIEYEPLVESGLIA